MVTRQVMGRQKASLFAPGATHPASGNGRPSNAAPKTALEVMSACARESIAVFDDSVVRGRPVSLRNAIRHFERAWTKAASRLGRASDDPIIEAYRRTGRSLVRDAIRQRQRASRDRPCMKGAAYSVSRTGSNRPRGAGSTPTLSASSASASTGSATGMGIAPVTETRLA